MACKVFSQCTGGLTATQDAQGNKVTVFGDLTCGSGGIVNANDNLCGRTFIDSEAMIRNNCCRPNNPLFFFPDYASNIYCGKGIPTPRRTDCDRRGPRGNRDSVCGRRGRRPGPCRPQPCGPGPIYPGFGHENRPPAYDHPRPLTGGFIDDITHAATLGEIVDLYWRRQNAYKCAAITNNTLRQAEKCLRPKPAPFRPANVTCVQFTNGSTPTCNFTINAFNAYKTINFTLGTAASGDPPCNCGILVDTPDVLTLNLTTNSIAASSFSINFLCPSDPQPRPSTSGTFLNSQNGGNFFGIDGNGFFVCGQGLENYNATASLLGFDIAQNWNNSPVIVNGTDTSDLTIDADIGQVADQPDTDGTF